MSEDAFAHCENLVRAHDKDRYLASLFAPAQRRPWLWALYAFDLEIARIKYLVKEPMAGLIRLQWWRDALAGLRAEEAAAHPVIRALFEAARAAGVDVAPLAIAVEARQDELQGEPPVVAASAVFSFAARLLGAEDAAISAAADDAAKAVTLIDDPDQARSAYRVFRDRLTAVPDAALPAFLTVALVPLWLKQRAPPQWRRQIALAQAAWLGFPKL
ncbi:MAG: squalene/phytoene synthase family protein [Pseudolabrys sp.]